MPYAEVVPNVGLKPTDPETFTYKVSPEALANLREGVLVEIPFHNRRAAGVVLSLRKRLPRELRSRSLQSIHRLLYPRPMLDSKRLALARWIAHEYLASLADSLFHFLPIPPKRPRPPKDHAATPHDDTVPAALAPLYQAKLATYLAQARHALAQGDQVLLLFPSGDLASIAWSYFGKHLGYRTLFYHGGLSQGERLAAWLAIQSGSIDCVIGSHLALFTPLPRLGLIILDCDHAHLWKQERVPRYLVPDVAEKLAKLTGARLARAALAPSIEVANPLLFRPKTAPRIHIVETHRGFFSETVQGQIVQTVKGGGTAAIFTPRRGFSTVIFCRDCQETLRCPICDTNFSYHRSYNIIHCHQCNRREALPLTCPRCHSPKLRFLGTGTERLEEELARLLPETRLLRTDTEARGKAPRWAEAPVVIGAHRLLTSWFWPRTLVLIINPEALLAHPDFRASERFYSAVAHLRALASETVLVETRQPDHYLLRLALRLDLAAFTARQRRNRRLFGYPPHYRLVRLVLESSRGSDLEGEADRIHALLGGELPSHCLLGPSPLPRRGGKERWAIILKLPGKRLARRLRLILRDLPSRWRVDVDPYDFS